LAGLLAAGIYGIRSLDIVLFQEVAWTLLAPIVIGIILGIRARRKSANTAPFSDDDERHNVHSFWEHWGTAAGILVMVVSGFQIRAALSLFALNLHFLGLFYTLLFGCYFAADFFASRKYSHMLPGMKDIVDGTLKKYLLKSSFTETGKYLGSQKAALLAFAVIGAEIVITGGIKMAAHFWMIPYQAMQVITVVHDVFGIFFVLLFLLHVGMVISVRAHRRLLGSWFTGKARQSKNNVPAVSD
jgi:cytochrome b subunit of formate dehydrogenase